MTKQSQITLIAISVGTPQTIEMNGKQVNTAIIKNRVEGPVYISFTGPAGDKPAVHPDAIYAIPIEHYDYWAKECNANRTNWPEGFFGDNFTTQGIDESELRIGDILRVGSQVLLQVVAPRVPCSKLSWRLGQQDSFLLPFALSGKVGFYLKVLQEGYVEAGNQIIHEITDPQAMTIGELSRLLVVNEASEEDLERILSHEHLGITSQEIAKKRLVAIKDDKLIDRERWSDWREFVIDKIKVESTEAHSFWIVPKDGKPIGGYRPGQSVSCRTSPFIYTLPIADFAPLSNSYRITIKKELFDELKEGSTLEVKAPTGSFMLDRSTYRPIVLISAEIGIVPMFSMLKAHIERELQPISFLYFIHVTKNGASHTFKEEIKELVQRQDKVKLLNYYTEPTQEDEAYVKGHFKISDLEPLMEDAKVFWGNRWKECPKQEGLFYLSGPTEFQENVMKDLLEWGVKKSAIYASDS